MTSIPLSTYSGPIEFLARLVGMTCALIIYNIYRDGNEGRGRSREVSAPTRAPSLEFVSTSRLRSAAEESGEFFFLEIETAYPEPTYSHPTQEEKNVSTTTTPRL